MAIESVTKLVKAIDQCHLLERPQLEEVVRRLQTQYHDPKALAKELLQRGWITSFHVKQLFTGRGGELVLGTYVLLDCIGEGGMGQVFKARHLKLSRTVALKIVRKEWLSNPDAVRRFHREIRAAAQLNHPNIVMAYDADQIGDTHFIAMEYVEGTDLGRLIKQGGAVPVPLACDYIRQAALGLQHAHEKGMVHRDIKPSNLLLTRTGAVGSDSGTTGRWGQVKILDMGLARIPRPGETDDKTNTLTHAGAVVGTPDYISPEQARDSRSVDIRADLYSLGCTLYHLITGHVLFPGGTGMEKLFKHQLDEPRRINELQPAVPPALAQIVHKLLAKKAEDRYQTPIEASRALEPFCQGDAGPATPRPVPKRKSDVSIKVADPTQAVPAAPAAIKKRKSDVAAKAADATQAVQPRPAVEQQYRPTRTVQDDATPTSAKKLPHVAAPAGPPRGRKLVLTGALLGAGLVVVLALIVFSGGKPAPQKTDSQVGPIDSRPGSGRTTQTQPVVVSKSPLDQLSRDRIPETERGVELPPEVVAVLGDGRMRHWGPVGSASFSPDGRVLATGGWDRAIRLWDSATGKQLNVLRSQGPMQLAPVVAFTPDGKKLLTLSMEGELRSWDPAAGTLLSSMPSPAEGRFQALSPDGQIALVRADTRALLWDLVKNSERAAIPDVSPASFFSFSPDGKWVGVWSRSAVNGDVVVYDTATGKERGRVSLGKEIAHAVAVSPDGDTVAAGSVRLLRVSSVAKKSVLFSRENPGYVTTLAFAPDGQTLLMSTNEGTRLLAATTGEERGNFGAGTLRGTSAVAFAPRGKLVAVAGAGGSRVAVWDTQTGQEKFPAASGHRATPSFLQFVGDGRTLVSASGYPEVAVYNWDMLRLQDRPGPAFESSQMLQLLGFTPDGTTVLSRDGTTLTAHDVATGAVKGRYVAPKPLGLNQVLLAPSGKLVAVAAHNDPVIKLLDVPTLQQRSTLTHPESVSYSGIAFSSNGQFLVTGDTKGQIRLWDTTTGQERPCAIAVPRPVYYGFQVNADGSTVAATVENMAIKVWDAASGRERMSIDNVRPGVPTIRFAPDGRTLGIVQMQSARLFDLTTGKERPLAGLVGDKFNGLHFVPDGKTLAVSDLDGQLSFHDVASGARTRRVMLPGPAANLAFTADARYLATGNLNGTIFILRLDSKLAAALPVPMPPGNPLPVPAEPERPISEEPLRPLPLRPRKPELEAPIKRPLELVPDAPEKALPLPPRKPAGEKSLPLPGGRAEG